ncbi:MAG: phosphoribosylanthranilate isomerase [Methylotenera sp.]|nr:phosphoribosylanthranilate isomerase [Methylotenera sp.]
MRTRVKICGITRAEDALAAVTAGADAIGLVFYADSPRNLSLAQAAEISRQVPAFVSIVGLFVDAAPDFIRSVLAAVPLDVLQFHGEETPEQCANYGLPFIKAIRVKPQTNLLQCVKDFSTAKALLLDTYTPGVAGGTGHAFDWNLIPSAMTTDRPSGLPVLILAGGLTTDNVASAIKQIRPYAVDVSGGVESAKGIKDAAKITGFMQAVYGLA